MPPPLQSVSSQRTPLGVIDVANQGQRRQLEGVWGVVVCVGEEEEVHAIALICQVLIQPGVDDGGKRSGVMLVGYLADNLRRGKGEEEALRLDGHDDDKGGYRGGGKGGGTWRGRGGNKGKRLVERS